MRLPIWGAILTAYSLLWNSKSSVRWILFPWRMDIPSRWPGSWRGGLSNLTLLNAFTTLKGWFDGVIFFIELQLFDPFNFVPLKDGRPNMMTQYLKGWFIEFNTVECSEQYEGLIRRFIVFYGTQNVRSVEFCFLDGWESHCDELVPEGTIYQVQHCRMLLPLWGAELTVYSF